MNSFAKGKIPLDYHYIKFEMTSNAERGEFYEFSMKTMISNSLDKLFGVVGGSMVSVDIIYCNPVTKISIVRVKSEEDKVKVCAALTSTTFFVSKGCSIRILASSPFLNSISDDSNQTFFKSMISETIKN